MPNILTLSGSPVENGSTEILLKQIEDGICQSSSGSIISDFVRINDLKFKPCQACGESPEPGFCLFVDELYPLYDKLINYDIILFGSPVYFDTISAQAKGLIDRCNCLRPPDFKNKTGQYFKEIITKRRLGAMVLAGGNRGEFECARKVIAGFFKWLSIDNCGLITHISTDWQIKGSVSNDNPKMSQAQALGRIISSKLE